MRSRRHPTLALALEEDQRRALLDVVVDRHALHALEALLVVDPPALLDRLVLATVPARLARRAALDAARQPVPSAKAPGQGQERAERAKVAAEELVDHRAGQDH